MTAFRRKRSSCSGSGARLLAAALLLAMVFAVLMPGTADVTYAATLQEAPETDTRVHDQANLFTGREKAGLEELTARCREATGMDVVVVTAFNDGRRTAMEYADDYYDYGGFGAGKKASGVLFLIYMDGPGSRTGDYWISTLGNMTRILTDERIEKMGSHVAGDLKGQDYAGAARTFLADIEYYVDKGIVAGQYNYDTETGEISIYRNLRWYEVLIAVAVSAFAALSACLGVKNQYAMKQNKRKAGNGLAAYRANPNYAMNTVQDTLVQQYVTHTRVARSSRGVGGGSSGRSSTHRSSSGRSHGGGGGRF